MSRSLPVFLLALRVLLGRAETLLSAADAPVLNSSSSFPDCTVKEPGGKWSVAIMNNPILPIIGKARQTRTGAIETYFPFVNHAELTRFRVIVCGGGDKNCSTKPRKFRWMDLDSAQRGLADFDIVELGGSSPFSILDARGEWQLGRIDAGMTTAWYVSGEGESAFEVFVSGPHLRQGRILCVAKSKTAVSETTDLAERLKQEKGSVSNGTKESITVPTSFGRSPGGGISASRLSPIITYALLAVIILNGIAILVVLFVYRKLNAVKKKSKRTNASPTINTSTEITAVNRSGVCSNYSSNASISIDVDQGEEKTRATINMDFTLKVERTGRTIGFGNFGIVEEGIFTDAEMGRCLVALKFQTRDQEDEEGNIIKELEVFNRIPPHRNIVKCFGGGTIEQSRCLVEELMVRNLDEVVHGDDFGAHATYRTALGFFIDIICGLEHLHRWGIVHCDLKPTNLLLDASNTVKIADFGISRKKFDSYITARIQGTLPYIAPEVLLAGFLPTIPIRANSIDVYSFGVIMWETVSGLDPTAAPNPEGSRKLCRDRLMKRTDDSKHRFPMNTFCPPELRDLIWNSVAFYADRRPTCGEIKDRLVKMNDAVWLDQRIRLRH